MKALELAANWTAICRIVLWIDREWRPGMYLRQVDVPGVDEVRSILMDRAPLLAHRTQWVREASPTRADLTAEEAELYQDLVLGVFDGSIRLEQERIRFSSVLDAV